jgi:hypothetical protein
MILDPHPGLPPTRGKEVESPRRAEPEMGSAEREPAGTYLARCFPNAVKLIRRAMWGRGRLALLLAIGLSPVADVHNQCGEPFVVDLVEDSVVADANPLRPPPAGLHFFSHSVILHGHGSLPNGHGGRANPGHERRAAAAVSVPSP